MIARLIIVLAIIVLGTAAYVVFTRRHLGRLSQSSDLKESLPGYQTGLPAIVYFWSTTCATCKTMQTPVIEELYAGHGDSIQIIKINAGEHMDLAGQWGVMSVPTTFILDTTGTVTHVNHGAARADKLLRQLGGEEEMQVQVI